MAVILNASTSSGFIQTADTSGELNLQSNGTTKLSVLSTGVSIGQFAGGVITSGTAVASTSGTSIDFTAIPSWVKRITVMFNGVSLNGSANFLIQLGDSGGFETTGYTSISTQAASSVSTSTSTTGFLVLSGTAAKNYDGQIIISNLSGNNWVQSNNFNDQTSNNSFGSGFKATSTTLDRVRITTTGSDTFDAGSINILYEG
jgi:hypothetical protein